MHDGNCRDFSFKGYVTVGILIATIQLMNYIQTPIQWISKLLADYKTSQPVLKRVTDILNLPKDADHGEKLKTALPISVENLRFSYEEGEEVLHNLSVTFEPGKNMRSSETAEVERVPLCMC